MSTEDALIEFVDRCINAIDVGKCMVLVFLDLRKAFDTVNRSVLLRKLEQKDFRGIILGWWKSYLSNRRMYVDFNNAPSHTKNIKLGHSQGAVGSPLLFLLYIDDMIIATSRCSFLHFADDTTIYMDGSTAEEVCNTLTQELVAVDRWLISNKLTLNVAKTSYIVFSHLNINDDISIRMRRTDISRTRNTKFLGVIIDDELKFKKQTECVAKKMSR